MEWEDMKNEWGPFWELKNHAVQLEISESECGRCFFVCCCILALNIYVDNGEWKMNGQTALVGVGEGLRVWLYDHDDDDTVDSFRKAAGSWRIKLTTLFERITVFDTAGYWKLHEWRKLGKLMNHSLPNTILKLLKQLLTDEFEENTI